MVMVEGIPCQIRYPKVRRAIRRVLRAIQRHPSDWHRVRRMVLGFEYFQPGERLLDAAAQFARSTGIGIGVDFHSAGVIKLRPTAWRWPYNNLIATIAHECGHAATREREFWARDGIDSEWASELCASRYVFKWGFERVYRKDLASARDLIHIGGLPGETIIVEHPGATYPDGLTIQGETVHLRVTPDFRLRIVKREPRHDHGIESAT